MRESMPISGFLLAVLVFSCGDDEGESHLTPDLADGEEIEHYHPECVSLPETQVIGNWDVVPFQRFEAPFSIGVVAFHELGVDVVFRVNRAPIATVRDPSRNPRTGVYEYWTTLDPANWPDGPIEVEAEIVPDCAGHLSRELTPIPLYTNSAGTLTNDTVAVVDCQSGDDASGDGSSANPYATIERAFVEVGAGGTVQLEPGDCYRLTNELPPSDYPYWTTVEPTPGTTRDEVLIVTSSPGSSNRFAETRVRWHDVQLVEDQEAGYSVVLYLEADHHVWLSGAELYDARGRWSGGDLIGGNRPFHVYVTDSYVHDIMNVGLTFARYVVIETIGSDILRGTSGQMVIDIEVRGIDAGETEAHPDFLQFYNPDQTVDNVVVYNATVLDMGAQGIFGGPGSMRNVAIVNLLMEKDPPDSYATSQLTGDWDHLLLWHLTTVDSGMYLREPDNMRNVFVQNNLLFNLHHGADTALAGWTIDHNQVATLTWEQEEPMGDAATLGDPGFRSAASDDYHLGMDSPAVGAGVPLPGVPADRDGVLYDAESPSLGAFAVDR